MLILHILVKLLIIHQLSKVFSIRLCSASVRILVFWLNTLFLNMVKFINFTCNHITDMNMNNSFEVCLICCISKPNSHLLETKHIEYWIESSIQNSAENVTESPTIEEQKFVII